MTQHEDALPYVVTLVREATDAVPERRTPFAAFAHAPTADWFTDQLKAQPGVRFETVGLTPTETRYLPTDAVPVGQEPDVIDPTAPH